MEGRINDKIREIEDYIEELYSIVPSSFEEYEKDFKTRASCERYIEKLVEAAVDLGFLVIKLKKFDVPENDMQIFEILLHNKIISENLAKDLKKAKGMRNVISHEYGHVDDAIIFDSLAERLEKDIKDFIKSIKEILR